MFASTSKFLSTVSASRSIFRPQIINNTTICQEPNIITTQWHIQMSTLCACRTGVSEEIQDPCSLGARHALRVFRFISCLSQFLLTRTVQAFLSLFLAFLASRRFFCRFDCGARDDELAAHLPYSPRTCFSLQSPTEDLFMPCMVTGNGGHVMHTKGSFSPCR